MDFAASEAKNGDSLFRKQRSIFAGNAPEQISPVPSYAPRPPDAPAQVRSRDAGRFCRGEKIFRPCGEQFAHKGCGYALPGHTQPGRRKRPSAGQPACGEQFAHKSRGYAPPGHTQPGQRKRPSAGQPACGEQFAPKGCGYVPPGLRRRPAAQNKKGTRIGCLSAWCG